MAAPVQPNRLLGIALRIGAASSFGLMAALIKLGHQAGVGTAELIFYRFFFGLPPLLVWMAATGDLTAWRTERPWAHVTRAVLGLSTMSLAFTALFYLPLAEATTIGFVAPFFAVMLSALVLKEKVGRYRWSAVAIGFVGVLVVMQPAGENLPAIGLGIALASAFGVAAVNIAIRQIGATEGAATTVLWFTCLSLLITAPLVLTTGGWHAPDVWAILAAVGLFGGLGQLFLTSSLRHAPIAVVVPFDYTQLLWAVGLGWLLFATQPASTTVAGAAIIIGSGLFTVWREHRLRVRAGTVEPE